MKTVIIGVGNPILSDDGVGIAVVRSLASDFEEGRDTELRECFSGGLRLMEAMVGFDRALVIDALLSPELPPGTITEVPLSSLVSTKNSSCSHDATLLQALEMGRSLGLALPKEIRLLGIVAQDATTFSETLSPSVAAALGQARERVLRLLAEKGEIR